MTSFDINVSSTVCRKCGTAYSKSKGIFPANHGMLYHGAGYLPYCRECVEEMYQSYLSEQANPRFAVRQMCRKLDLFWSDGLYDSVEAISGGKSFMSNYLGRLNSTKYIGKSYDDTLRDEGTLWDLPGINPYIEKQNTVAEATTDDAITYAEESKKQYDDSNELVTTCGDIELTDEIIQFWGPGSTKRMYREREQRYRYWKDRLEKKGVDVEDIGVQALLRQICNSEISINEDSAAGKPTDRQMNTLNTLLGSAALKPNQAKDDSSNTITDNTPFGVWIKRWEDQRPIPEPDPELKDVDGIIKYIEVWFKGHLSKMLGLKNAYSSMYEKEIESMRIERPEFDDEDDEAFFNDVFGSDDDG